MYFAARLSLISTVLFCFSSLLSTGPAQERDERPFPNPGSKKGLQVQMLDDGIALGIKHATLNVSLGTLIDLERRPENPAWEVDGQRFSFHRSALDHIPVKPLSDAGVNVYLIL